MNYTQSVVGICGFEPHSSGERWNKALIASNADSVSGCDDNSRCCDSLCEQIWQNNPPYWGTTATKPNNT